MPLSEETRARSRILIADDNQQNRELLDAYLADEDFDIAGSRGGPRNQPAVLSPVGLCAERWSNDGLAPLSHLRNIYFPPLLTIDTAPCFLL
jgi:CheY-like chemotaxis protein